MDGEIAELSVTCGSASKVSLLNFIKYNVIGGGQSALYGVESVTFYLRNGLLNFNIVLILSYLLPLVDYLTCDSISTTAIVGCS